MATRIQRMRNDMRAPTVNGRLRLAPGNADLARGSYPYGRLRNTCEFLLRPRLTSTNYDGHPGTGGRAMNVGDLCRKNPVTVRPFDDLIVAARLMREKHVGYVVV